MNDKKLNQSKVPSTRKRLVVTSILILLIAIIATGLGYFSYIQRKIQEERKGEPELSVKKTAKKTLSVPKKEERVNVLVMGLDAIGNKPARADFLVVVSTDPKTNQVTMLSIPQFTQVKVENRIKRISDVYELGGPSLTIETLKKLLDIPIHHYLEINYVGFEKIVDGLDGVDIVVDKTIVAPRRTGNISYPTTIIRKGKQHLTGREALAFVHFKQDKEGDIGRIKRQQKLIATIGNKILSIENIPKILSLINLFAENVKTDMTLVELTSFANKLKNVKIEQIQIDILPGHYEVVFTPDVKQKFRYWIPDPEKMQQTINRLIKSQ